ncbi:helix-turn-helix domain-containing protein (plasmid) [Embleya sp. NBC_00888]|uniref:helix-turn-helix domain-containing protein n=1 Tax=Embleya sp. NBC_00888 TaxID=2975960 RepID=UPI0038646080|nr:helix-turn-helix domain-containing protein [Embleya sp. NBC_00888]
MHGLLSKLAGLDSSAERGLRVVEFFDQLVLHRADLEAVTRATAVLAETVAGAVLDQSGDVVVVSPAGRVLATTGPGPHARVHDVIIDTKVVGRVWLERSTPEDEREWDELIVERMAQCLATLTARNVAFRHDLELGFTDPAVLHVLIGDDASETETARAARLLGFRVGEIVRVLAVHADTAIDDSLAAIRTQIATGPGTRSVAAALSSTLAVVIVAAKDIDPLVIPDVTMCIGPPVQIENCRSSWAMARRGVRFSALGGRWPAYTTTDELGCLTVLADLEGDHVAALPDVQAITRIATGKSGSTDLRLLECLGSLNSLRDIAEALHMHHSSVAYRVGHLCKTLGYDVRTQDGRYRARTALTLWRLYVGFTPTD